MKNQPKKIYLNITCDDCEDFKELDGVTWCSDRVNDSDICYVLESEITTLRKTFDELLEQEIYPHERQYWLDKLAGIKPTTKTTKENWNPDWQGDPNDPERWKGW